MNSFMNGANERRMKAILEEELPGVPITASSEVLPEIFEHERFSTTVVNAVLTPVIGDYAARLGDAPRRRRLPSDLLLLHSGGGVMTAKGARQFAGRLAGSGIAAGAIASRHIAMQCGYPNSIGLDMGGTSTDISLVYEGQLAHHQGLVCRVRLPDPLPLDRGADDRRRRRLARLDRRGRLAAQRPAIGRRRSRAGLLRPRQRRADEHRRATSCSAGSGAELVGGSVRLDPALARDGGAARRGRPARAGRWTRPPRRSSRSPTPTWPTRCG